jgi:hypothetical protein
VPYKKEDRYCAYKRNIEACSHNHCCNGRAMSIIYSECVSVALVFQHAVRMLRIVFYLWPVWLYKILPHSHKRQDFRNNFIENKMRVFIFSTSFVWKNFYSKNNSAIYHNVLGIHVKFPLLLPDCNETWIFSTDFRKIFNLKFHENPSVGNRGFPYGRTIKQTDGRKDRETWRSFSKFCERSSKIYFAKFKFI